MHDDQFFSDDDPTSRAFAAIGELLEAESRLRGDVTVESISDHLVETHHLEATESFIAEALLKLGWSARRQMYEGARRYFPPRPPIVDLAAPDAE